MNEAKRGRPRKNPTEQRSVSVTVRFTAAERELISLAAKTDQAWTESKWVRETLLEAARAALEKQ